MSTLRYACTALVGRNKTGELKPDENGYYRLVLGALNFANASNIYYDYESSRHVFENSNSFMRRMSMGNLYSEQDHPPWEQGVSLADYIRRIKFIDMKNVCAHICDIEVVAEENAELGGKVMVIYGSVKPDKVHGQYLEAALKNPKQNVCFSLRALCDDNIINGRTVRTITDLITFDWVIEPGISKAHKYNAPGLECLALESIQDIEIPLSAIRECVSTARQLPSGVGMEAEAINDLEAILSHYDTDRVCFTRPSALATWN